MTSGRDISLDLMKAIGILSIIIGHYGMLRGVVYSFHVPLFFIIGGYVFRTKSIKEELITDTKRLLVPYVITACIIALWKSIIDWRSGNIETIPEEWLTAVLGCGLPQDMFLLGHCNQIGAIWFLPALFVCRVTYNSLFQHITGEWLTLTCLLLSIGSILFYNYITPLPFDILQGISMLLFYDFGCNLKIHGGWSKIPNWGFVLGLGIWNAAIYYSFMEIVTCNYRCYPLDIIGAICATCIIGRVAKIVAKLPQKWTSLFVWIGRSSLGLLCLHLIDLETNILHKVLHYATDSYYHNPIVHCLVVILVSCAAIYIYDFFKQKYLLNKCKNS